MADKRTYFKNTVAAADVPFGASNVELNGLLAGEAAWSASVESMTGEAFARIITRLIKGAAGTDKSIYSVFIAEELNGRYVAHDLVGGDDFAGSSTTAATISRARGQMRILMTQIVDATNAAEFDKVSIYSAPAVKFKVVVINDDTAALGTSNNSATIEGFKAATEDDV